MIYTFYSFKGGVGRSMAMASVAWLLARRGLRVLVIDFDLEAPGLERYFFNDERTLDEVRGKPGLVDLLLTYKRALTSEVEFQRAEFRNWRRFVSPAVPNTPEGGSVDLMSSGRRHPHEAYTQYALDVRAFDWQDFFHNWQGGSFFDWLRRALTDRERDARNAYDVVLVDSRTGVTEMGGVCAYQLADAAVLLCAPNWQNMDGTRAVLRDFRSDAVVALRQGRPLEIVLLPARVEPSDAGKRDQFFDTLRSHFGSEGLPRALMLEGLDYERLAVPYQKELAIIERVVDEGADADEKSAATQSAIRRSFETLTDALLLLAEGPRWQEVRDRALARLRGQGPAPAAVKADVIQRGSGYDAFLVAHPQDWLTASSIVATLSEHGLDVLHEQGALESARQDQALSQLMLSRTLVPCIGAEPPSDAYWRCYRQAQTANVPKPVAALLLAGEADAATRLREFGLPPETPVLDLRPDGVLDAERTAQLLALLRPRSRHQEAAGVVEDAAELYPGADAYSEDQAGLLFARDEEAEQLLALVRTNERVLLEGPPGVGKRSLINAGLLPRMRRHGMAEWRVVQIRLSGQHATAEIEAAVAAWDDAPVLHVLYATDSFPFGGGAQEHAQRLEWVRRFADRSDTRLRLLVVWSGTLPDAERAAMERAVVGDTQHGAKLLLGPLTADELRQAIEQPAARAGHLFEPGLVDRVIRDAGARPGAVAQVQIAMRDVWAGRRRGWLTNRAYDDQGGIAGRHEKRLEGFLLGLSPAAESAARTLLKNLVRFDTQLALSAQAVEWEALASIPAIAEADAESIRDQLVAARLIDLWRGAGTRGGEGVLWCALAQPVTGPRIEGWARADAEFLLWRQRFAGFVERDTLVARNELDIAQHWLETHGEQVTTAERDLVRRSADAHEAALEREHRMERERARLLQRGVKYLAGGLIVSVALLIYAVVLSRNLQQKNQALVAEGQEVARQMELRNAERQTVAARRDELALELGALKDKLRRLDEQVDTLPNAPAPLRQANAAVQAQAQQVGVPTQRPNPAGTAQRVTIYVQIASESQRPAAEALAWQINHDGDAIEGFDVTVAGVERVKTPVKRNTLRCFDPSDCTVLAEEFRRSLRIWTRSPVWVEDLSGRYKQESGRFELWFAAGTIDLIQPPPALLGLVVDVFRCGGERSNAIADRIQGALPALGAKQVRQRLLDDGRRTGWGVPEGVQVRYSSSDPVEKAAVARLLQEPVFAQENTRILAVAQTSPGYLSIFACASGDVGF